MTNQVLAALLALTAASHAAASPEPSIPLRELYAEARIVAVVEVIEGRVVAADGESCGARYKGRVIEGTKGATVSQVIEFGFAPSLKIGSKYFVLLAAYENVRLDRYPEFHPRCKSLLPDLAMVGIWRGAMEVTTSIEGPTRRDAWTVRPANLVEYPIGTRSKEVDGRRQLVFTDMVTRMKDGSPAPR
ncbi:hypothetical protein [Roseateles sp.]|uniref:hypothetical protein n=1 Tax=Roseateles sp. TaxID=1971397 RepID=UPI0039ED9372